MNKIILVFIFLGLCFSEFAQAQRTSQYADVFWGEEYKEPPNSRVTQILGTDAEGFYALRLQSNWGRPYLEHYYHDMTLRKSRELEIMYKGILQELEDVIYYNGEIYMLTSYNNEAKNANFLFMQGIFKNTFTPKDDIRIVGEIPARTKRNEGEFRFSFASDSSHFLIYYGTPYKPAEPERFGFRVFDDKMEEVWYKEISLPYPDQLFDVVEFRVDKKGDVYLLGKLYLDQKREKKGGRPNYQYVVLAYMDKGEKTKQYKIKFADKFITDMAFRVADNGDLVCAGLYSERGLDYVRGTCFFKINAQSEETYNTGYKEFPADFLEQFMTEKQAKKGKQLYNYDLRKMILRSDGGAVLVAEQYYVRIYTYRDYFDGRYYENYYYYYNDIIVANINPDGSVAWVSKIPKKQVTSNDGGYFSSYAMSVVKDKLFFIFNDHPNNANEKDPKRLLNFNGKRSVVTLAVLKSNGDYDKYALFSNQDADILTRPVVCKQSGPNEMLVYGERNKKYKFGLLKFHD